MHVETVEEYLARGGQIERFEYVEPNLSQVIRPKSPPISPANLSLDEGAHYFAIQPARGKRTKPTTQPKKKHPVKAECIPEHLRRFLEDRIDESDED